jgi:hypothetical protein
MNINIINIFHNVVANDRCSFYPGFRRNFMGQKDKPQVTTMDLSYFINLIRERNCRTDESLHWDGSADSL